MLCLDCPIQKQDWIKEVQRDGIFPKGNSKPEKTIADAGPWEAAVQKIVSFEELKHDWDGLGAEAPSRDLLQSAIGLAYLFSGADIPPPQAVVPGTDGSINFEWQDPDGTMAEVEIDQPFHAEVMIMEPGKPAKFWTLPTE